MKSFIIIFFLSLVTMSQAQTDLEIGSVHLKRAEQSYLDNEMRQARKHFDKAILYIKEVNDGRVARIGALLSFDIKDYTKAKILAKRYFELEEDNTTEDYEEMLELFVTIDDALKAREIEEKRQLEERIRLAKEQRRLDSLSNVWLEKSKQFYVSIDSIGAFNKHNIAIYKSQGNLGIMDDFGNVVITADMFQHVLKYDGYMVFMNASSNPSSLFCYNSSTNESYYLPNVTQFNSQAYDFGKVMLPRANGLLVSYPSNTKDVMIFDLNNREFQTTADKKELLKTLKKNDIIDKYDKDLNIKLEKEWYALGNSIGGSLHPLFTENSELYGFLSTSNGRVFTSDYYNYMGAYCDGKFQVLENGNTIWMDAEGLKHPQNTDQSGIYSGNAKFIKDANGKFKILHTKSGKDIMVLGDDSLLLKDDFIEMHSK